MGALQHLVALLGIVVELLHAGDVDVGELPVGQQAVAPVVEAAELRLLPDVEVELEEADAVADDRQLELRRVVEELAVLLGRAEAHHRLDAGAVVPRAVEGHELARRGELRDIALEVPLAALRVGRLGQRHVAGRARVEILADDEDGAALAGRVAALEQRHQPLAARLQPGVQLDELGLQELELLLVGLVLQLLVVGIAAGADLMVLDPVGQVRILDVEDALLAGHLELDRLDPAALAPGLVLFHA